MLFSWGEFDLPPGPGQNLANTTSGPVKFSASGASNVTGWGAQGLEFW